MNSYKEIKLDKFCIVGISIRTTNSNGQSMKDISELWEEFFTKQISSNIQNKVSEDIYCIYTDYESDYTGEYTTIIGCNVSTADRIPEGLVLKEIRPSNYRVYTSEGDITKSVGETWMSIWQEGTNIDRIYQSDFDVYGNDKTNSESRIVKTYLSIK